METITQKIKNLYDKGSESEYRKGYTYHLLVLIWVRYLEQMNETYLLEDEKRLRQIFSQIDFEDTKIWGKDKGLLGALIEGLSVLRYDDEDRGGVYDELLDSIAKKEGRKGETYWIPKELGVLVGKLMEPKGGERVYDPLCGLGRLLLEVGKQSMGGEALLYGQEKSIMLKEIAKSNLSMHGYIKMDIALRDNFKDLERDRGEVGEIDIAVCCPLFETKNWIGKAESLNSEYDKRFRWGMPPVSKIDYALVLHMLDTLRLSGRMAIVLGQGALFRTGKEQKIRENLIRYNLIDTVVGLPSHLFYHTGGPICLLILKKMKQEEDVLFVNIPEEEFCEKNGQINRLTLDGVEKIVKLVRERKTVNAISYLASREEIEQKEYSLSLERYIVTLKQEEVELLRLEEEIRGVEKEWKRVKREFEWCMKQFE